MTSEQPTPADARLAEHARAWRVVVEETREVPVQVNGKLRDTLTAPKGAPREALEEMALASEKVSRILEGKAPRKVIVVPDRLVNVVA